MTNHCRSLFKRPGRLGFTMIEILVVLGIIGLLVTLLVTAMAPSLENARIAATKSIIAQVDQQLQRRMMAFNAIDEDLQKVAEAVKANWPAGPSVPVIKVLIKENRYLAAFPQRVQDLFGMDGAIGGSNPFTADAPLLNVVWKNYLDENKAPLSSLTDLALPQHRARISSSELIYLQLTQGNSLGTETYSLDGISSTYITDEDGDGLMEIRDAWGNELWFYNAPTSLFPRDSDNRILLNQGARILFSSIPGDNGQDTVESGELFFDPFDKLGRTSNYIDTNKQFYHRNTYFSFLIVSAGPDRSHGLREPNTEENIPAQYLRLASPLSLDELFDNITNRQQ